MADSASNSSTRIDDLNPQDVYKQINAEIVGGKKVDTPRQKTRSNYAYVILLNISLLATVSFGIFLVSRIFREQGIRLTAGTGGIQSLELILAEQEERRRAEQLLQKEAALLEISRTTDRLAQELEDLRGSISAQVELELVRQRDALALSIGKEMEGKTQAERAAIQERYAGELRQLRENAAAETDRRMAAASALQQEDLARRLAEQKRVEEEITLAQQLSRNQQAVTQETRERRRDTAPAQGTLTYDDQGVAVLFNAVERQLRAGNTAEAERTLQSIERLYTQNLSLSREKLNADLFLVSLIRDYMSTSNKNASLVSQIIQMSNTAAPTAQVVRAGSGPDLDMERFRILVEEISFLINHSPNDPELTKKIQTLQKQIPDAFVFYDSYRRYRQNEDSRKAAPLIAEANGAYARRNFPRAVENYQGILTKYPGIPEQPSLLSNFYQAVRAVASDGKGVPYSTGASIVYMRAPDGYVMDLATDSMIISFLPGANIRPGARVRVFKVNTANGLELSLADTVTVGQLRGSYATAASKKGASRIGDLVYLIK